MPASANGDGTNRRSGPSLKGMINTSATKMVPLREDGGLLDPHPARRAARLDAAGVRIERWGPFNWIVREGDHGISRTRTLGAAQRRAHALAATRS